MVRVGKALEEGGEVGTARAPHLCYDKYDKIRETREKKKGWGGSKAIVIVRRLCRSVVEGVRQVV